MTLREVARVAGVSHTAAYNHFADKNDLLRGLAIRAFDVLAGDLRRAVSVSDASLETAGTAYLRFAFENQVEFRFMFRRDLCMPAGTPDPLEVASRAAQDVLQAFIVSLQDSGRLRQGDPDAIALAVWSQIHGITTIVIETPAFKSISMEGAEQLARDGLRRLSAGIA